MFIEDDDFSSKIITLFSMYNQNCCWLHRKLKCSFIDFLQTSLPPVASFLYPTWKSLFSLFKAEDLSKISVLLREKTHHMGRASKATQFFSLFMKSL